MDSFVNEKCKLAPLRLHVFLLTSLVLVILGSSALANFSSSCRDTLSVTSAEKRKFLVVVDDMLAAHAHSAGLVEILSGDPASPQKHTDGLSGREELRYQRAFRYFLPLFTVYAFGANGRLLVKKEERKIMAVPEREEILRALQIFTLYQRPYSPTSFSLEEFLYRYHLLSRSYGGTEVISLILDRLAARVPEPMVHDQYLEYEHGPYSFWVGLRADIRNELLYLAHLNAAE